MLGKNTKSIWYQKVLLGIVMLICFCASAEAALKVDDLHFESPSHTTLDWWGFNDNYINPIVSMYQTVGGFGVSRTKVDYAIKGSTKLEFYKVIKNTSGQTWTGYKFKLKEGKVSFAGIPWSSKFGYGEIIDGDTIVFSGGTLPGDGTVVFDFDIMVLNPEPATALLLGLGGIILRISRRKSG